MPPPDRPDDPDPTPPKPSPETVSLLRRCKEGDRQALEDLATRFYPAVSRIVRARAGPGLRRREDLEDLVQDAFVRVLEGLEKFEARPDAHFVAYLAHIAHNVVVNKAEYYRAQKRDVGRELSSQRLRKAAESSVFGSRLVAQSTSVPDKVAHKEIEQKVDECLSGLDEDHREVILLRNYAGADWVFIAKRLDRSVAAAQQLHNRARVKLTEAVRRWRS